MAAHLQDLAPALRAGPPVLRPADFEGSADGKPTRLYTLRNARGMEVSFTNLGAKIQQILVPDRDGAMDDVALGYDSIAGVIAGVPSMGAFVGRFANRIARGAFELDGRPVRLSANSAGHVLHGGARGSLARVFDVVQLDAATARLTLYYREADDGFPGNLMSRVIYRVSERNELSIEYDAVSDAAGVVNMTSHVFFNLAGHARASDETLGDHLLTIAADEFTPTGAQQIPTGELRPVRDTPMDFRLPMRIADRWNAVDDQLAAGGGYDHNWVAAKRPGAFGFIARLQEPSSGRAMEVYSSEPGIVFYSGNKLGGDSLRDRGKGGKLHQRRSALCLEPAHFPDSPNHPHFPDTAIRPGQWFSGRTVYAFTADIGPMGTRRGDA